MATGYVLRYGMLFSHFVFLPKKLIASVRYALIMQGQREYRGEVFLIKHNISYLSLLIHSYV